MLTRQLRRQRGSAKAGCLVAVGVALLVVLIVAMMSVGRYNKLVTAQETIEAAWSEIDNQYKRRFDLIPQLVKTVQGRGRFREIHPRSGDRGARQRGVGRSCRRACRPIRPSYSPTSRRSRAWAPRWRD